MTLSEQTYESLKKILNNPELQIYTNPLWGSRHPEHRELMRAELAQVLENPTLHTSISHCPELGILVASHRPVGVDVEVRLRAEERIVARISSSEEMSQAPSFPSLWCAKEAAYKALRPYEQPSVISKISIGDWEKIDSQTETYRLLNSEMFNSPSENKGVIFHLGELTFSFFNFLT